MDRRIRESTRPLHVRVVIANFGMPAAWRAEDYDSYWADTSRPVREQRLPLFEYKLDWGFHIMALGIHMMDTGIADEVEFWNFTEDDGTTWHRRGMSYHYMGVLRVNFVNEQDVAAYIRRYGVPDLFVNHGRNGIPILRHLEDRCFRVHVPASRYGMIDQSNHDAECYLVDAERFIDGKSMLYVPVVNTRRIFPTGGEPVRDFVYLAWPHRGKRHDVVVKAARDHDMSGRFHPVPKGTFDLNQAPISTSEFNEVDLVQLLGSSRIAVYPGDNTSNPAAMWECVAAGLPIVVNENILGGHHLVVPGVTGEFASESDFGVVMRRTIDRRNDYKPREYFDQHWSTAAVLDEYLDFLRRHGWGC